MCLPPFRLRATFTITCIAILQLMTLFTTACQNTSTKENLKFALEPDTNTTPEANFEWILDTTFSDGGYVAVCFRPEGLWASWTYRGALRTCDLDTVVPDGKSLKLGGWWFLNANSFYLVSLYQGLGRVVDVLLPKQEGSIRTYDAPLGYDPSHSRVAFLGDKEEEVEVIVEHIQRSARDTFILCPREKWSMGLYDGPDTLIWRNRELTVRWRGLDGSIQQRTLMLSASQAALN